MITKRIATGILAVSLGVTPIGAAMAGSGDAIVGGIIGGMIGGAIVNEGNKQRRAAPARTYRAPKATVSSAQREANREVQTALNHFGYPVGTPDGAIGPRSRAAISEYQATLGYPPTGQLTEYERAHLIGSYHRAVAGGALTMQQAAANPMGMRGLLVTWRDEAAGIVPQAPAAPLPGAAAPGVMAAAPVPAAPPAEAPAALPQFAATPAVPALPSFLGGATTQASLASHCNKVNLVTSTNGGFITAASMSDPAQALGEQFCLARGYAITQGEDLAGAIAGFSPAQIAEQCATFGPALKDHVAALSIKPRDEVLSGVSGFALGTGMAPAQLAGTARVCLSVGYKTDDMNVAIGSGLLLTALGEKQYGELLGHHLALGFGTSLRPDLALDWYQTGLDALGTGAVPVFAPDQAGRGDLIRKAAYTLGGRVDLLPVEAVPATLPDFAVAVPEASPAVTPVVAPVTPPAPPVALQADPTATPLIEAAAPAPAAQTGKVGIAAGAQNLLRLPQLLFKP